MTVYVDEIRFYPHCKLRYKYWCHLATDGELEELHQMAARLGLRRQWFQDHAIHPHYDLTPPKRVLALRLGAVPVTIFELVARCRVQRGGKEGANGSNL